MIVSQTLRAVFFYNNYKNLHYLLNLLSDLCLFLSYLTSHHDFLNGTLLRISRVSFYAFSPSLCATYLTIRGCLQSTLKSSLRSPLPSFVITFSIIDFGKV